MARGKHHANGIQSQQELPPYKTKTCFWKTQLFPLWAKWQLVLLLPALPEASGSPGCSLSFVVSLTSPESPQWERENISTTSDRLWATHCLCSRSILLARTEQLEIFASAHFSNILLLKYNNRLLQERRIWWSSHCEPHSLTYCSNHLFFCSSIIFLFASLIWESSLWNSFATESSIAWRGQSTEGSSKAQGISSFRSWLLPRCCRTQTPIYIWWIKFLHLSNGQRT